MSSFLYHPPGGTAAPASARPCLERGHTPRFARSGFSKDGRNADLLLCKHQKLHVFRSFRFGSRRLEVRLRFYLKDEHNQEKTRGGCRNIHLGRLRGCVQLLSISWSQRCMICAFPLRYQGKKRNRHTAYLQSAQYPSSPNRKAICSPLAAGTLLILSYMNINGC